MSMAVAVEDMCRRGRIWLGSLLPAGRWHTYQLLLLQFCHSQPPKNDLAFDELLLHPVIQIRQDLQGTPRLQVDTPASHAFKTYTFQTLPWLHQYSQPNNI